MDYEDPIEIFHNELQKLSKKFMLRHSNKKWAKDLLSRINTNVVNNEN